MAYDSKEKERAHTRKYYLDHKDMINARNKKYKEAHREHYRELGKKYAERTREHRREYNAARHMRLRLEALYAYGGKCTCCGESETKFLAIDHINGGGNTHRKESGVGNIFIWLKNRGYPPGFQVLCHNCNMAKGIYGECPHKIVDDFSI